MALYYELQVFKDVYTLVQKVFLYTQEFPREYKYTLGQDMKRDAIQLVRSIYRANKAKDKVVYLETFLDDFELLKFEIPSAASSVHACGVFVMPPTILNLKGGKKR